MRWKWEFSDFSHIHIGIIFAGILEVIQEKRLLKLQIFDIHVSAQEFR